MAEVFPIVMVKTFSISNLNHMIHGRKEDKNQCAIGDHKADDPMWPVPQSGNDNSNEAIYRPCDDETDINC